MQPEDNGERGPTQAEAVLARMEEARRQGCGVRLTNDELCFLSVSTIGDAMEQARNFVQIRQPKTTKRA